MRRLLRRQKSVNIDNRIRTCDVRLKWLLHGIKRIRTSIQKKIDNSRKIREESSSKDEIRNNQIKVQRESQ